MMNYAWWDLHHPHLLPFSSSLLPLVLLSSHDRPGSHQWRPLASLFWFLQEHESRCLFWHLGQQLSCLRLRWAFQVRFRETSLRGVITSWYGFRSLRTKLWAFTACQRLRIDLCIGWLTSSRSKERSVKSRWGPYAHACKPSQTLYCRVADSAIACSTKS